MKKPAALLALVTTLMVASPAHAETMVLRGPDGKDKLVQVQDAKNAWVSGIASALIPGVGQWINGDVASGFLFLGGNVGLYAAAQAAKESTLGPIGIIRIGVQVWSIVDAASRANTLNDQRNREIHFHMTGHADEAATPESAVAQ